jgi:light-regulated signal transduction histidine kinase (bacteriophytochrome)
MQSPPSIADAEAIAQEFKDFAYNVSHDLHAPIRAMVEFSRLLKAENPEILSEESKLYLSMIIQSGEKLQAMLMGLLDYSRLNTLNPFTCVDFNSLLGQCRVQLKEKIAASKGVLEIESLPTLQVDADQCRQLFFSLLDNAFKFSTKIGPPYVHVAVRKLEGHWLFTVKDNGIGIASEFHAAIYAPFYRLHGDKEYSGVGMGLALAKKIVTRHDGKMWVESSPGNGTSFHFTLPVSK